MRQTLFLMVACLVVFPLLGPGARASDGKGSLAAKLRRFDVNRDGKLSAKELPARIRAEAFPKYDANGDAFLSQEELTSFLPARAGKDGQLETAAKKMKVVSNRRYAPSSSHPGSLGLLDLYLPRNKRKFPLLFFVHGGGFVKGDKASLA